jgi:hypothetical protein
MTKTITATFDGEYLRPDNPVELQPNQRYLITIQPETQPRSRLKSPTITDNWY